MPFLSTFRGLSRSASQDRSGDNPGSEGPYKLQLLSLLLGTTLFCLASAQQEPSSCSTLHPDIVARISKELAPWAKNGISEALMRNASQLCPPSDRHLCRVKFIQVLIEDGQMYLTSIFPRSAGNEGYSREAAGTVVHDFFPQKRFIFAFGLCSFAGSFSFRRNSVSNVFSDVAE